MDHRASRLCRRTLLAAALVSCAATPAAAGWLRPLDSGGNFAATVDVANLRDEGGGLDVVVMISVQNRELTFEREGGRVRGELEAHASLAGPDGVAVQAQATIPLRAHDEREASSPTLRQVFTLVLPDVRFATGVLSVRLQDNMRRRPVLFSLFSGERARSELTTEWTAPEPVAGGVAIGDLVYLAQAPVGDWVAAGGRPARPGEGGPWDYLHPTRLYGLEQPRVQVYFNVLPPSPPPADVPRAVQVEVLSKELDFAMRDTVALTADVRAALAGGRAAAVYYELDGSLLPPGSFRLGIAPLAAAGGTQLGEFDVSWRLDHLARGGDRLVGEGRLVFRGERLARYLAATRVEQEVMLEEFWRDLDPDPADAANEIYAEFRRRVAYAEANLGGFGTEGPRDDRGLIYVLLGPPDQTYREVMPMNEHDLEDARIKVYEPYAPDREGSWAKGADPSGSQSQTPYTNRGGIPMPYTRSADREIIESRASVMRDHGFELWTYHRGGQPLFANPYSSGAPLAGLKFLFVDTDATGKYRLESSNLTRSGD